MFKFSWLTLCLALILLTQACVNNSLYSSATRSGYGYSEEKLNDDKYRIQFVARGDKIESAKEHALLRAAELCLTEEFFWFEVLNTSEELLYDNKMDPTQLLPQSINKISGNCDIPRCGSGAHQIAEKGTNLEIGDSKSKAVVQIEILMLMGERPKSANIYSARDTYKSLRKKLVDAKAVN